MVKRAARHAQYIAHQIQHACGVVFNLPRRLNQVLHRADVVFHRVVDFDRRADFFRNGIQRVLHTFRQHCQQRVLFARNHRRRRQRVVWVADKFF